MRVGTPSLVAAGLLLGILSWYNQNSSPLFGSLLAFAGAAFLFTAARRLTNKRKQEKVKNISQSKLRNKKQQK